MIHKHAYGAVVIVQWVLLLAEIFYLEKKFGRAERQAVLAYSILEQATHGLSRQFSVFIYNYSQYSPKELKLSFDERAGQIFLAYSICNLRATKT